jgi:hypothetical protein
MEVEFYLLFCPNKQGLLRFVYKKLFLTRPKSDSLSKGSPTVNFNTFLQLNKILDK